MSAGNQEVAHVLGYLDAGSVSAGLSILAAGVAGVGVAAKGALGRFRRTTGNVNVVDAGDEGSPDDEPATATDA